MAAAGGPSPRRRRRVAVRVTGTVQGVGFRPYVYRRATALGVAGFVRNEAGSVAVEAEGEGAAVDRLIDAIASAPPPAAVLRIACREIDPIGEPGFRIGRSRETGSAAVPVPPDIATCPLCLAELRDPDDRRHRYPFVNCTACGPRFTIVRSLPYDRANTTMAGFEMCAACRAEYEDPGSRRFHAEPNACPSCGPRATLLDPGGRPAPLGGSPDAVAAAAGLLRDGRIVAVKGVGGWHLACRADSEEAVDELRRRKRRESKPFAILAPDPESAGALADLGGRGGRLLAGPERPIVLAPRRPGAPVASGVAPGCTDLGVMLPHSPLHHLLAGDAGTPLVMTSGNVSTEPIVHDDADALRRLGPIADALLAHDRPIETPAEDSVVRAPAAPGGAPVMFRRSRGYAPASVPLAPAAARPLVAAGADLKSCPCVASGDRAWPGPQAGDLGTLAARRELAAGADHLAALCRVEPEIVAHDLHPDYASTRWALGRDDLEPVAVQHHHAHFAACLAEHGHRGPAVGAIFDGAGLGDDGTVWGGEILAGDARSFTRAGAIAAVPLPGGDAAAREGWRMACSWLRAATGDAAPAMPASLAGEVSEADWAAVAAVAAAPATPVTTSAGRLFDAIAALAGIRARSGHEGQAAMELEAAAVRDGGPGGGYRIPVESLPGEGPALLIDPREAVLRAAADASSGSAPEAIAARFHDGLAAATAAALELAAEAAGADTVVLSGGAFQNGLLLAGVRDRLSGRALRVLVPERLPPNDGGIGYGQAAVAAAGLG